MMCVTTYIVTIILFLVGAEAYRRDEYDYEDYQYAGAGGLGGNQTSIMIFMALFFYFIFQRI